MTAEISVSQTRVVVQAIESYRIGITWDYSKVRTIMGLEQKTLSKRGKGPMTDKPSKPEFRVLSPEAQAALDNGGTYVTKMPADEPPAERRDEALRVMEECMGLLGNLGGAAQMRALEYLWRRIEFEHQP